MRIIQPIVDYLFLFIRCQDIFYFPHPKIKSLRVHLKTDYDNEIILRDVNDGNKK